LGVKTHYNHYPSQYSTIFTSAFAHKQQQHGLLHAVLPWLLLVLGFTASFAISAQNSNRSYQLGRGYGLGDTGIRLGGYASAHIDGFGKSPWSFDISDLSLFVSWDNGSKFRFFSELEVEDVLTAGEHQNLSTKAADFRLERLYLDYLVNENLTVRIGKILTPVGQWNLVHADPLVWTTNRPVSTDNLFSEHASGIMLHGNVPVGKRSLDYSFYADYSSSLDPKYTEGPIFDNAVGFRLRYSIDDHLKIGFSYADFALKDSRSIRNHLAGLDLAWTYQRYAINSEIVYRNNSSSSSNNLWQGYVQGVSPIAGNFYAVGRYEFFDQTAGKFGQVGVVGLAYRPIPPLVWKLEYQFGENNRELAPDGLFASFAVLF
jgi:hypothetical protein